MNKITLEQQAAVIERYKTKNGIIGRDFVPVNSGVRRTESKRALLAEIASGEQLQQRRSVFTAKY